MSTVFKKRENRGGAILKSPSLPRYIEPDHKRHTDRRMRAEEHRDALVAEWKGGEVEGEGGKM